MSRRRRGPIDTSTLGGNFDAVTTKINENILDTVALMHPCPVTMREISKACIAPEVREALMKAKKYKATEYYDKTKANVKLGQFGAFQEIELHCMVPKEEYISLPTELKAVLEPWYEEVLKLWQEWMIVRHVAAWFNNNASHGAMRYYWPCIMSLLPPGRNLDMLHKSTLEKYKEPVNVSKMLPLCRTTATLVTSGQMLPPRDPDLNTSDFKFQIAGHAFDHVDYTGKTHRIEGTPIILRL